MQLPRGGVTNRSGDHAQNRDYSQYPEPSRLVKMRQDFHQVNQQLYALLKTINYKGNTVYWQKCPMAFDGDKEAYWLDAKSGDGKMNPYLGKNDPKFGSGMLHCGEEMDSVVAK